MKVIEFSAGSWVSDAGSGSDVSSAFDRWFAQTRRWHVLLLLLLAFAARLPILFALDTVTTGWHSSDYGSIARNYYLNGFHFAYPAVDWGGDGPGYVEMEFPIVPYLTALIYSLAGAPDDRLAVIVPLFSGLLAVVFTYFLARELFRPSAAFLAGAVAALAPVSARYSELFFPEASLLACSVGGMYAAILWYRSGRLVHLAWAAVATSLAILLKPTALVLGAPLLWLFWLRYRGTIWRQPLFYLFGLAVLAAPIWWYVHALQLAQQYGNSFGILFGGGDSKFAVPDLLLSGRFYAKLAYRLVVYHLTPIGLAAVCWALLRVNFTKEHRAIPIWFFAAAVSFFIAAEGNDEVPYYQLPIIPPACLLAGVGLLQLERDIVNAWRVRRVSIVAAALAALLAIGAVAGMVLHHRRADYVAFDWSRRVAGMTLAPHLRSGALIVYSTRSHDARPRGHHVTPPYPFYFSGHRGWYVAPEWLTVEELERLRGRGAEYFVGEKLDELGTYPPAVLSYLESFPRVPDQSGHIVWDLRGSDPRLAASDHAPVEP